MRIIGKKNIIKLKKKNVGNKKLCNEIDKLITDLESFNPISQNILDIRKMLIAFIKMDFTFLISAYIEH